MLTSASQALKTHLIPLTSIVNRALDISAQDAGEADGKAREEIVEMCMRYLDTDTLLCWAPKPSSLEAEADTESLRSLQIKTSQKITSYLTTKIFPGVEILPILSEDSIIPISQPQTTKDIIRGWITGLPAFELAGLERAVLASKSLCIGIRLIFGWSEHFQKPLDEENKRREESKETEAREERGEEPFGIEEAAQASSLEVAWQTGMWGEVEDTHDVDKEDLKRQFGTVILMVSGRGGP